MTVTLGTGLYGAVRASGPSACKADSRTIERLRFKGGCSHARFDVAWACTGCFHFWFSGLAAGGARCHSGITLHGITGGAADLADAGHDRAMRPAFGAALPAAIARGISRPGMDCVRRAGACDDCGVPLRGAVQRAGDCGLCGSDQPTGLDRGQAAGSETAVSETADRYIIDTRS